MYRFDGSTVLVIHIDVTHTVTHQTTHILPPAGTQNALGESHKKASTQQATRRTGVLARCRRAHCARFGRWRSQKHRWWPSAGVSGGGRDLTLRADDPTSRGTTQPQPNPTRNNPTESTILKLGPHPHAWALILVNTRVHTCRCVYGLGAHEHLHVRARALAKIRAYTCRWSKTCLLYTSPSPRDRG